MDPVENLEDYICQKHELPLELFCRDDQTSVCQFCTETDHKTHSTVPIEEESGKKKTQLVKIQREVQQKIQNRLKKLEEITHSVELSRVYPSLCSPPHTKNWTDVKINTHLRVETLRRALTQLQEELSKEMEKMMDVTLDPDSAHCLLILSDDGKQVTFGDKRQNRPDTPERFDRCPCVLGKEGFSSGRFYYEVQVSGKTEWDLGVTIQSVNRTGAIRAKLENGYWTLFLRNETEYRALDSPSVPLSLKQAPQKVGVFVDYEEGLVSFYDVEARSHIYSFTGQSFTAKLYPLFSPHLNNGGDHKTHSTVPIEEEIQVKKIQMGKTQVEVQQMIQHRLKKIEEIKHSVELSKVYPSLCSPPHTKNWTDVRINTHLRVETLRRALTQLQKELSKEMGKLDEMVDVTLDPDSAHPQLFLSDDRKQVRLGDKRQKLPDTPERFDPFGSVLGKEGFSSGRFYYEVQVRKKTDWALGVTTESSNRKGVITASPEDGYWIVVLKNETEYKALESLHVPLSLEQAPQKVGVFVDYEEGLVSFYDVEASSHIYSFTGQSFTEKIYPYFSPGQNNGGKNSAPLIITPVKHQK
ncbi:hypothetical protein MHYP_G00015460 [Metynnis hypsauchen]